VQLVFTDPPYDEDSIELYAMLLLWSRAF